MLGRALSDMDNRPRTTEDFDLALVTMWSDIEKTSIQRIIRSMRSRIDNVITANRGNTRY